MFLSKFKSFLKHKNVIKLPCPFNNEFIKNRDS